MAVVPGPPTSLAQVRAVFGAPAGTPLHQFYRGGPWVPNIAQNNGVPTAPPIRLAQLAGATNYQAPTCHVDDVSGDTVGGVANQFIGTATANTTGSNPITSYHWQHVSGSSFTLSADGHPNINFNQPGKPLGPAIVQGQYKCTVSDGITTVDSNVFTVTNNIS